MLARPIDVYKLLDDFSLTEIYEPPIQKVLYSECSIYFKLSMIYKISDEGKDMMRLYSNLSFAKDDNNEKYIKLKF